MASSSNQRTDRSETIWGLGPVKSRMTQNALGDNFVDQFQDNSEKDLFTAAKIPTVKVEPENKPESSFGEYFKKTYNGVNNRITRTVKTFPEQNVSEATRLVQGALPGLGMYPGTLSATSRLISGGRTGIGMCPGTLSAMSGITPGTRTGMGMYPGTLSATTGLIPEGRTGMGIYPGTLSATSGLIQGGRTGMEMYPESLSATSRLIQGGRTGMGMYPETLSATFGITQGDRMGMYPGTLSATSGITQGDRMGMHQGTLSATSGITQGDRTGMYPDTLSASSRITQGDRMGMYPATLSATSRITEGDRMGMYPGTMSATTGLNQLRPSSAFLRDVSNPMPGLAGQVTLEELELQEKKKTLMNLQLLQAQNTRLRMELKAQKRREAMGIEDEMMRLIQNQQMKEELSRETEDIELGEKNKQDDIERLKKEMEMLKKQMSSKNGDDSVVNSEVIPTGLGVKYRLQISSKNCHNSAVKPDAFPTKLGVKHRLGLAPSLGDPQELKKNVFDRLGLDGEKKGLMGELREKKRVKTRRKRAKGDEESTLRSQSCKKRKKASNELPADLVLTELSDAGPVPAAALEQVLPK